MLCLRVSLFRKMQLSAPFFAKTLEHLNYGACCFHSFVTIGATARNLGNVCNCYMYELCRPDAQPLGFGTGRRGPGTL